MIGKNQLVLDASEWLKGMSSGTHISDGGFSTDTDAVNLTSEPGIVYAPAARVDSDTDTTLTDEIIASAPDHVGFLGENRLVVCENGTFLSYNGAKLSAILATDGANTYRVGFTDFINYAGESYITSREKITRWSGTSTFDHSFFTFANALAPHSALVFENNAYYADKNLLLRQTSAAGTPVVVLTLALDQIIMALGVDPGTGKMLLSTTSSFNASGSIQAINKLLWYDGSSNKLIKTVIIGETITSFQSVGSTVYVGYGTSLGFINGSGVQFLRKLKNVSLDVDELPYQHKITTINNILCIVDGDRVLAYGEVFPGKKIFYYILRNKENSNKFKSVFSVGGNKLGLSVATSKFHTVDITDTSTLDEFNIRTNLIRFPRAVHIRNIQIEFFSNIASTGNLSIQAINSSGGGSNIESSDGTITGVNIIRKFKGFENKQDSVRFNISNVTTNAGLASLIIYYDFAE